MSDKEESRELLKLKQLQEASPDLADELMSSIQKMPNKLKQQLIAKVFKSTTPQSSAYYSNKFALMIIEDVREAIKTGCVLVYDQEDYPKWAVHTLYLYVYHAIKYLAEVMDEPDGKFKLFKETHEVREQRKKGRVLVIPKCNSAYSLKAKRISMEEFIAAEDEEKGLTTKPQEGTSLRLLRDELFDWMERAQQKDVFLKNKVFLSEEEKEELESHFGEESDFGLAWLTPTELKIVRLK